MADLPTFNELFVVARDEHLARNGKISRQVLDTVGTEANAICAAMAAVGDELVGQLARVEAGLYYGTATGDRLRKLAWSRDQITPKLASPAGTTVLFVVPTTVSSSFTIPRGTRLETSSKAAWYTIADTLFVAGSSVVPCLVKSVLSGSDQQVTLDQITSIVDVVDGAPAGMTVFNEYASFGGTDDETEAEFQARLTRYYIARRRGTTQAIAAYAMEYPGVVSATAFEDVDAYGTATRIVHLYVTDTVTAKLVDSFSTPASYSVQVSALIGALQDYLADTRAGGIQVVIDVANVSLLPVQLGIRYASGSDPAAVAAAARAAAVSYVNSLAIGASYVSADLETVLATVPGLVLPTGTVISPVGTVTASVTTVLRTTLDTVTLGVSPS